MPVAASSHERAHFSPFFLVVVLMTINGIGQGPEHTVAVRLYPDRSQSNIPKFGSNSSTILWNGDMKELDMRV